METCRVEAAVCWDTLRAFTTHHQLVEVKTSKDWAISRQPEHGKPSETIRRPPELVE